MRKQIPSTEAEIVKKIVVDINNQKGKVEIHVQSLRDARHAEQSNVLNATWRETQAIRQTANAHSQKFRAIEQALVDMKASMEQDKEQAKRLVPKALGEIVQNALYEIVAENKYREGEFPLKAISCPR